MKHHSTLALAFIALTTLVIVAPRSTSAQSALTYTVTDLGKGVTPHAVNDSGQVVGSSLSGPFLWTPSIPNGTTGSFTILAPVNTNSKSEAINARGQVIGTFDTGSKDASGYAIYHAFVWNPSVSNGTAGAFTDLNSTLPAGSGWTLTRAHDINNAGQIVGEGTYTDPQTGLIYSGIDFGWERDAAGNVRVTRLDLGPSDNENPSALNNLTPPQVVGAVNTSTLTSAFICQANMPRISLGQLGEGFTQANKINDGGQVVGISSAKAFLWTPGATNGVPSNPQMQSLQPTSGVQQSKAFSINNSGLVVGVGVYSSNVAYFGFVWDSVNGWRDLNNLSGKPANWQLQFARNCNNRTVNGVAAAQIVASGSVTVTTTVKNKKTTSQEAHGFLMTP